MWRARLLLPAGPRQVADAVQKHFNNLAAMGKDEKSIRTYRYAVNGFVRSYKKPSCLTLSMKWR